jgi:hypothetical protein
MKTIMTLATLLGVLAPDSAYAFGKKPLQPAPAPAPAPAPKPTPKPTPAPGLEKTCPAPGSVQAVDLSAPVDQRFLDAMRQLKVSTIVRYYDHVEETINGKTLLPDEADLLARNGFDAIVVFQHNNNKITSFTSSRGTLDARRSLSLAGANGQSPGSAIYFGVDGGWSSAKDLAAIKAYFGTAAPVIRAGGFQVGAYGSGLVCNELRKAGLVDLCWLANATAWPGYREFLDGRSWTMVQRLPTDCGGKNVDFNVVNSSLRDLGQFRP